MHGNSRMVRSAQTGVHPRLREVVARHLARPWRRPLPAYARVALEHTLAWLGSGPGLPLVLDSGCGTAASSRALIEREPGIRVIAIDRSAARLGFATDAVSRAESDRLLLVRAPLEDYWRLLVTAGVRPQRHLILYPNPWPKPEHLMRRWHAHPVFPHLLDLGGTIEVRSNWRTYLEEFALALEIAGGRSTLSMVETSAVPWSPFERKYRDSGHVLWRLSGTRPASHPIALAR